MATLELPPQQQTPASWYGLDWADRTDEWTHNWTPEQLYELTSAATSWRKSNPYGTLTDVRAQDFKLPTVASFLRDLRETLIHGRGFTLLRGLDISDITEDQASLIFMGVGCHIGSPRSQNAQGHLLGHVRDTGARSTDANVRIYQTRERQTFHTDSCDVVGLLCLKQARSGGDSLLVSSSTIFNEMRRERPDLLELLLQPIATDRRGEVPPGMLPYYLIPVFNYYEGYLTAIYQRQYIESAQRFPEAPRLTEKHHEALDLFDTLANDPRLHFTMRLQPGDMQFVYNHALLHDRTGFDDYEEDARKRHLLRLWLAVEGDRPLPECFAQKFGSVTVGDRGGIVVR